MDKERRRALKRNYYKNSASYREYCKNYSKEYKRTHTIKKPTKTQRNRYMLTNRWRYLDTALLSRARRRARDSNMEFDLVKSDINIPKVCPILGIELKIFPGQQVDGSIALDRIDNTKGYIKTNICVISHRANRIKSDGTAEEHEAIAKYIREHKQKTEDI